MDITVRVVCLKLLQAILIYTLIVKLSLRKYSPNRDNTIFYGLSFKYQYFFSETIPVILSYIHSTRKYFI